MSSRTRIQPRAAAGFTLLELMLAISILALVLVMIAGSFNAVIHSKVHGEARLEVDREGRAILAELADEIRGAVQTPAPPSNVLLIGKGQMRDGVPIDAITFATLTAGHRRAITGFDTEQMVAYSVTLNPRNRKQYILTRSQRSALLLSSTTPSPPPIELADNVVLLHFKYFDLNAGSWVESWDSTALPPPGQLPEAVSIDLALAAGHGQVLNFSTQVLIPMAVSRW
jgi:prepilin-type N-terminal cleavage/methylation domain-containing protein